MRTFLLLGALAGAALGARDAAAQDHPAKRLASIVSVAVDEYGKAVDARGRLISDVEYRETVDFLKDAAQVATRLSGSRADQARAVLDSLVLAVEARRPPEELAALHRRFTGALGADAALDMPVHALDLAAGQALYEKTCAACHGASGRGDGPAAAGMSPAPAAVGDAGLMHGVSPALSFRVTSVGISGTPMVGYADKLTPDERWNIVAYLQSMRSTAAARLEGEGLYLQRCASCHGPSGAGDGAVTRALTRLPPEIGSLGWQAERSDSQIAATVRGGIPGTAMPGSSDLSDRQVESIVAYLRTLPLHAGAPQVASAGEQRADDAARQVMLLLDQALAAAQSGRMSDAGDRAFDSYIAFEPLESTARAKNPGLVASMERHFADFKGAVKAGDLRAAERARNAVEAGLPSVVELTRSTGGRWGAFFQSLLIILREGFEAILVIGAVVAFLLKTGHRERLRSIWIGAGLGILASAVTAIVLKTALSAIPASREILEGVTMLVAVAVLFSVSYWLISKVEAAKWQAFIREKVTTALEHGGGKALAFVAFLAVYREGAETALFYQALFNEGTRLYLPLLLGIVAGGAILAVIFTLFYRYGVRIPLRPFFTVTSALLYYMAFVFAGKGVRELQEGDALPITAIPGFPHVDAMGIFPSVETLLAQLVLVVLLVFALVKTFWPKRSVTLPTIPPAAGPAPDVAARLAELDARNRALEERLAALETGLADQRRGDAAAADERPRRAKR